MIQDNKNNQTLAVYEDHFDQYAMATPGTNGGSQKDWIDYILSLIQKDDSILEIGAAHGRDAVYIRDRGYKITPTDAFERSVKHLKVLGFESYKLNILKDVIGHQFSLILAAAVLVHFDQKDAMVALASIRKGLEPDGLFAFSVKQGEGDGWSNHKMNQPRYFYYWSMLEIKKILDDAHFEILDTRELENGKWIHIVCRKKEAL